LSVKAIYIVDLLHWLEFCRWFYNSDNKAQKILFSAIWIQFK